MKDESKQKLNSSSALDKHLIGRPDRSVWTFHFAFASLLTTVFILALPSKAQASANSGVTYHGRILNPDGTALQGSSVQFLMQIRSPGAENCLLYQEVQTINMAGTDGVFSISINDGTGTRTDPNTWQFDSVFSNLNGFSPTAGSCAAGTSYTPNYSDGRNFVVSFRSENMSGYEALPAQAINFSPLAIQAKYIDGLGPTNLLRVDNTASANNLTPFNSSQLTNLQNLINGTSTQYLQDSTTSGAVMPVVSGTPTSPSTGSVWYNSATNSLQYYNGTTAQTLGSGSGSGTVTSVAAGTGLTGGTITTSGTIALATAGTAGTYYKVTTDAYGRVTSGATALVETDIPTLVTAGKVSGAAITSGAISGTTSVSTAGAITTTGTVTAANVSANNVGTKGLNLFEPTNTNSVSLTAPSALSANYSFIFPLTKGNANQVLQTDGAGQASWVTPSQGTVTSVAAGTGLTGGTITTSGTIALATSGVTASTYKSVTVDTYGRVTAGSNPTTLSGFGITDGVQNAGGTPSVQTGLDAAKPPAATVGRVYVATDTQKIYSDSGSAWTVVGSNSGAGGTVTSVALSAPTIFTVSASPVTTTGTLGLSLASETAHQIFAAPQGANGAPSFRNFNISDLMSSVSGGFLTGSSCTSGQALVYSSITDTIACSTLSLSSSQVTTALGFAPVANGGGTPSVTTGLDASKPTAGSAGRVYVATDTQKIYSDSGSAWTVVGSNAGAGGTISGLSGDVSATGSGTVAATVNSVGGSTAANVHSAELAANSATAANTASKIILRDSSGNFAAGTATLSSAVVGQTNGVVYNDGSTNFVGLTAPTTVTTSYVLKLPPAVASNAGQVLTSDTSGNLSWTTPSTTATAFSGILPVANGGTGTATGSITGTGALTLAAGGTNQNVTLTPSGSGYTILGGNVGIGTSTPYYKLHTYGSDGNAYTSTSSSLQMPGSGVATAFIQNDGYTDGEGAYLAFQAKNSAYNAEIAYIGAISNSGVANSAPSIVIGQRTGNNASSAYTERLRVDQSGNVGVGTTTPQSKLDVNGSVRIGADSTTCSTTIQGAIHLNGTVLEYCNGSSWTAIGTSNASGTVTSITAGAGLSGGTITTSGTIALATQGTSGTYNSVTVDAYGRITAGSNPTTLGGYGITDGVANLGGSPGVQTGLDASKPASPAAGAIYFATDTKIIYQYNAGAWVNIASSAGSGGTISSLTGDVTASGTGSVAATVASVGGSTASNVHSAELAANAATSANTASKIITRDGSGNFAAGTATLASAIVGQANGVVFNDTTATPKTVGITAPTTVTTSYVLKLPPAVAATTGQVLTSDTSGNLTWTTPSTVATSYSGILPIANGGTNSSTALNNNRLIVSSGGAIVEAGVLTNGQILIGSTGAAPVVASLTAGSGVTITPGAGSITIATSGASPTGSAGGDLSGSYPGPTVAKLQGIAVSTTAPTLAGQMLRYNGTSWTPNFVAMTDLRSTITGTNQFANTCTSSQTLSYNSVGDVMSCTNISIGASNFSSQTANTFLAAPNGSSGAPSFRGIVSADLPTTGTAGTFGSATQVPVLTTDAYGRVTSVTNTAITTSATTLSGLVPVANGGTGTATGSITGTGALAFAAGGSNQNITLTPSGSGSTLLNGNVGIGTTAPTSPLDTVGVANFRDSGIGADNGYNGAIRITRAVAANQYINFTRAGNYVESLGYMSGASVFGFGGGQPTDTNFGPNHLSINIANGNVGVGTTTPTGNLDIENGANTATLCLNGSCSSSLSGSGAWATSGSSIYNTNSGNVGIGTISPNKILEVQKVDASAPGLGNGAAAIRIVNNTAVSNSLTELQFGNNQVPNSLYAAISGIYLNGGSNTQGDLAFSTRNIAADANLTERMRIMSNGNVGIGTSSPTSVVNVVTPTQYPSITGSSYGVTNDYFDTSATNTIGAVYMARSARGSLSSPSATQSGDILGQYTMDGYTGAAFGSIAATSGIASTATQNWTTSGNGSNLQLFVTPNNSTTDIVAVTVDQSGNVGIGTASPNSKLEVAGAMRLDGSSSGYAGFKAPATMTTSTVWTLPAADGTANQVLQTNGSGVLSWATASGGGVTGVAATAPVVSSGGTAPVISMAVASSSANGYLSGADWTTFNGKAPLASPTFTGAPAAPTATANTNTTQLATTAFVLGQASSTTPAANGTAAVGTSTTFARADHVHATDTSRAPASGSSSITTVGTVTSGTWNATTIAVANGGTGLTSGTSGGIPYYSGSSILASSATLPQNQVLLGGGAAAAPTAVSGTGTSGQVLTSNGLSSAPTWQTAAGGGTGFSNLQSFTASGTFTVPAGVTKVKATVVGGGGGGGANTSAGPGGGGGGSAILVITGLTPGGTVTVTVGAAGAGGTNGGTGGTSSFGSYISATGGSGGNSNQTPGSGGVGSSGSVNMTGSGGGVYGCAAAAGTSAVTVCSYANNYNPCGYAAAYGGCVPSGGPYCAGATGALNAAACTSYNSGTGGSSYLGGGGYAGGTTGGAGGKYGGGGGGGSSSGGAGAAGIVIVEY